MPKLVLILTVLLYSYGQDYDGYCSDGNYPRVLGAVDADTSFNCVVMNLAQETFIGGHTSSLILNSDGAKRGFIVKYDSSMVLEENWILASDGFDIESVAACAIDVDDADYSELVFVTESPNVILFVDSDAIQDQFLVSTSAGSGVDGLTIST